MGSEAVQWWGEAGEAEASGVYPTPRASVIAAALDDARRPDDPRHGDLPLSRYAAIGALLRTFPRAEQGAVLGALGLDVARWERAHTAWLEAMRVSDERGEDLLPRWSRAFDGAWELLAEAPPTIADISSLRRPPAPVTSVPPHPETLASPAPEGDGHARAATSPEPAVLVRSDLLRAGSNAKTIASSGVSPASSPRVTRPPSRLSSTAPTASPPTGPALPFRVPARTPGAAASAPALTLEQYASLCVELEAWPGARGATLARYGIVSEAMAAALAASWGGRLVGDAALAARFAEAKRAYGGWIARMAPDLG